MNKLNQKIPSGMAFSLILILSFLLSWFTVAEGEKIAENAKKSPVFDVSKRMQK